MQTLIKIEELALAALAFFLFLGLDTAWWWFFALLLAPDLSMLGYLFGPKTGALAYNLVHHRAVAVALFVLGAWLQSESLQAAALILLAHASLDRVFGYGLKFPDSFQNTHLGRIRR